MVNNSNKIWSFQYIKAVACILVMLLHYVTTPKFLASFFHLGNASVELFFVITGFLTIFSVLRIPDKSFLKDKFNWLLSRFLRIYILFFIITCTSYFFHQSSWKFNDFLLAASGTVFMVGSTWVLPMFYLLYFISFLSLFLKSKFRIFFIISFILLLTRLPYFISFSTESKVLNFIWGNITTTMNISFIFGILLYLLYKTKFYKYSTHSCLNKVIYLSIFSLTVIFLVVNNYIPLLPYPAYPRYLAWGIPAFFIVASLLKVEMVIEFPKIRWLDKLGDISFSVYLIHWQIYLLNGYIYPTLPQPYNIILNVIITLLVSILYNNIEKQYILPRLSKIIK